MIQWGALFKAQVLQKKNGKLIIRKTNYKEQVSLDSLKSSEVETAEYSFLRNTPQRLHTLKE